MTMCRLHGFQCDVGCIRRERAENTAGVQPARAFFTENLVPIDLPSFEMRNSGVPAVVRASSRTHAESPFREIQPVARRTPDAIVSHPADVRLIDATLVHQVLQQPTNRVVCECRDYRRVQTEAAL